MSKKLEHHSTRLGTTDSKGHRIAPQPEATKGKWTTRRSWFYSFLIGVYLVLPWVYVDGKQWVRLDIPAREFVLFGTTFYGHDATFLIFIFLGFIFLISFITSYWGRAWCGWACPQTVFIDTVYRRIETWVEGSARKRKALNKQPFNFEKLLKKGLKWFLFLIVSLHIVHSFLGYFVGTRELLANSFHSPADNWTLFVIMLILTGITLFDFGWFREQFCVIACPYGRFQSVLMDENSLVVAYDEKRGEPRRGDVPKSEEGDCINCYKCVKVCPTGIDIRRGTQMECIACTMCIDACDEIMEKVHKPKGLIRYSSENELSGQKRKLTFRSMVYLAGTVMMGIGLVLALSQRSMLSAQFLRMPGAPFTVVQSDSGSELINRFEMKVDTLGRSGSTLRLSLSKETAKRASVISGELPKVIKKDKESATFFLKFKASILHHGSYILPVNIQILKNDEIVESIEGEVKVVGPL